MPPKFYKHKLLLDEGLYPRKSLKRINNRYNIKHIKHDLCKGGIKDSEKTFYGRYSPLSRNE